MPSCTLVRYTLMSVFLSVLYWFAAPPVLANTLSCPSIPHGGLWTNEHGFPRLVAINAGYISGDQTLANYDEAASFDLILSGSYLATWTNTARLPVSNYAAYLRNKNPNIKLVPFFHAYGFLDPGIIGGPNTFPDIHAISQAATTAAGAGGNGWWLVDQDNQQVSPWASSPQYYLRNQYLLNWSFTDPTNPTQSFPQWMSQYVNAQLLSRTYGSNIPYWDGYVMEADTNEPHQLAGARWDLDENQQADNFETTPRKGKVWMDEKQTEGWNYVYQQARQSFPNRKLATGGELWSPGLTGIESQPASWQSANLAMVIFLESIYFDPSCGGDETRYWSSSACGTLPPEGKRRMWDLYQKQAYQFSQLDNDRVFLYKPSEMEYIQQDNFYGSFFTSNQAHEQYIRFLLGSAYLVNAYAQPGGNDILPVPWCDECGVDSNGESSVRPVMETKGWMGCPLDEAKAVGVNLTMLDFINREQPWQLSNYVWQREFEHALVLVNPTTEQHTVLLPSDGWKRIKGVADPHYNSGERITGEVSIPPMNAVFLLRDGAPAPSPGPVSCQYNTDLNQDGSTDIRDLSILARYWLASTFPAQVDISCDGQVNLADFTMLVRNLRV